MHHPQVPPVLLGLGQTPLCTTWSLGQVLICQICDKNCPLFPEGSVTRCVLLPAWQGAGLRLQVGIFGISSAGGAWRVPDSELPSAVPGKGRSLQLLCCNSFFLEQQFLLPGMCLPGFVIHAEVSMLLYPHFSFPSRGGQGEEL